MLVRTERGGLSGVLLEFLSQKWVRVHGVGSWQLHQEARLSVQGKWKSSALQLALVWLLAAHLLKESCCVHEECPNVCDESCSYVLGVPVECCTQG